MSLRFPTQTNRFEPLHITVINSLSERDTLTIILLSHRTGDCGFGCGRFALDLNRLIAFSSDRHHHSLCFLRGCQGFSVAKQYRAVLWLSIPSAMPHELTLHRHLQHSGREGGIKPWSACKDPPQVWELFATRRPVSKQH